jgi:hypothetical protein
MHFSKIQYMEIMTKNGQIKLVLYKLCRYTVWVLSLFVLQGAQC